MTLYARQQKRHRCKKQSFGLCGRRRGWGDLREWHWNMYIIIYETDHQSRLDAWDRVLRAGALGWSRGMWWRERWERGSGWGTHVHPWLIHVSVWQKPLQCCKVISLQLNKLIFKKNLLIAFSLLNMLTDALLFWGAPKSLQMVTAAMKLKYTPWKQSYDQPR